MADVPAPNYPNYANFLSNLIGGLPTDYRNAQQQQTQIDVSNTFKNGVPTNPDGTTNWAAALQMQAKAGDPGAVAALGPLAQQQSWLQQAQAPSPMLSGAGIASAPAAAQPPPAAPIQPPAAAPQPSNGFTGTIANGAASPPPAGLSPWTANSPPTVETLVASAVPDAMKGATIASNLAKALRVDQTKPLTPDQLALAQRYMLANKIGGQAPPAPAPASTDPTAAAADMAAKERAAGYDPNAKLTQDQATALATGKGGATGPFALPPAAEAVWDRMILQESGGKQFNPDGTVVTSPKGAVGVAQVLPGTGPEAAKLAGLPWDPVRFKNDPNYNRALGKAYYAQQVKAFGSPDIAAAAYNAGPKAMVSAMAKATSRGGSWLDYMPAETQDYVAKVASPGAAPQAAASGGAGAPGNRPIVPQVPLPPGITDPQQAILAIDREIARLGTNPYAKGQVDALADWRDRIAQSTAPMEVGATTTIVDPRTGQATFKGPYASGQGSLNPEALDVAAEQYFQTGKIPPNMGRGVQGSATMNAIINRAAELHPDTDWAERPQAWQAFAGGAAGQSLLAKREAALALAENSANALIPRVREASKNVSRTQYPALNTIIEAGLTGTGDPNIVKFGIAVESLAQTYARVLSPSGSPTAADKANAHEILSKYWGQGQIDAALDQMEKEIASEKQSLETTRQEMGGGGRGGDQGAAPPTGQDAANNPTKAGGAPPPGTKYHYDVNTGEMVAQ